jgi:hypothetical protein
MKHWKRTFKCRGWKSETSICILVVKQFVSINKGPDKTTETPW